VACNLSSFFSVTSVSGLQPFFFFSVTSVSGLQPQIIVEPLPKAVLQVFGPKVKGSKPSFIPQADLSEVDKGLVDSLMPFQREGVK
jgi:hypothetical protein